MMMVRHLGRMGRDIVQHALDSRSPWLLLIVGVTTVGVLVTAAVKVVTPVVLYPFL